MHVRLWRGILSIRQRHKRQKSLRNGISVLSAYRRHWFPFRMDQLPYHPCFRGDGGEHGAHLMHRAGSRKAAQIPGAAGEERGADEEEHREDGERPATEADARAFLTDDNGYNRCSQDLPICHTPNKETDRYCSKCHQLLGDDVEKEQPVEPAPKIEIPVVRNKVCPKCKKDNPADYLYCQYCGERLS
ncbi:MAG: zinc ribbon domain-containing protein [Clostridia bacterium]|nr:zinc ribbon domain-containing protein [Clostridia bacterium]